MTFIWSSIVRTAAHVRVHASIIARLFGSLLKWVKMHWIFPLFLNSFRKYCLECSASTWKLYVVMCSEKLRWGRVKSVLKDSVIRFWLFFYSITCTLESPPWLFHNPSQEAVNLSIHYNIRQWYTFFIFLCKLYALCVSFISFSFISGLLRQLNFHFILIAYKCFYNLSNQDTQINMWQAQGFRRRNSALHCNMQTKNQSPICVSNSKAMVFLPRLIFN